MTLPKDCPIGPQRKRSPKKNLESHVVRECLAFLNKHPDVIYIERRNTGAVQFQDGRFIRFGSKGAADIWCLVRMKNSYLYNRERWILTTIAHIEIECKRADGKGRLSPDQKRFREFCDSQCIPYILATSTSDLEKGLAEICS